MTEKDKIVNLLNEYYGCDPMYFGIEADYISAYLVSNDVIPVVKCKVCSKCKRYYGGVNMDEYMVCTKHKPDYFQVCANDFCSYGERRTDNEAD